MFTRKWDERFNCLLVDRLICLFVCLRSSMGLKLDRIPSVILRKLSNPRRNCLPLIDMITPDSLISDMGIWTMKLCLETDGEHEQMRFGANNLSRTSHLTCGHFKTHLRTQVGREQLFAEARPVLHAGLNPGGMHHQLLVSPRLPELFSLLRIHRGALENHVRHLRRVVAPFVAAAQPLHEAVELDLARRQLPRHVDNRLGERTAWGGRWVRRLLLREAKRVGETFVHLQGEARLQFSRK